MPRRLLTLLSLLSLTICLALILMRLTWHNSPGDKRWTSTTTQNSPTLFTARTYLLEYYSGTIVVSQCTTHVTLDRQLPSPASIRSQELHAAAFADAQKWLNSNPDSPSAQAHYARQLNMQRLMDKMRAIERESAADELKFASDSHERECNYIRSQRIFFLQTGSAFPSTTATHFLGLTFITGTDTRSRHQSPHWSLLIPSTHLILFFLLLPTLHLLIYLLRRPRPRPGFCPKCNYNLRASKDRCPECGSAIPPPTTNSEPRTANSS